MSIQLPDGWERPPLGKVLTRITYGFTNPMPTTDSGPYMVTAKDIRNGRIDYATARRTSVDAYAALTDKSRPRIGDILLTKDGSIGRVAVCDRADVCINQSVALLQPSSDVVSSTYLAYLLQAPIYQQSMAADADGSTIKHIYITRVDKMPIALPPMTEQQAIAAVLGALDDKIATNTKMASSFEALGSARFQQLGLDVDDALNHNSLEELFEVNPRRKISSSRPTVISMQTLPTTQPLVSTWSTGSPRGGTRFMNGDTLVARITPSLENRKTAFTDFLKDGEVGIGSTEFIVLRSKPPLPFSLSYFLATSPRFRDFAIQNMSGTSGRQRVAAADLARHRVARVSETVLRDFGIWADVHLRHLGSLRNENTTLAATRDALLPALMSGKLSVKDAERQVEEVV